MGGRGEIAGTTESFRRRRAVLILAVVLASALALPIKARAVDESHIIGAISCPAATFCAGLTPNQPAVVTADPTAGGSWTATDVSDEGIEMDGVSCPSTSFCAIVDYDGDVITSTEPAVPTAWSTAHVDFTLEPRGFSPFRGPPESVPIEGISCPSTTLCVAVDSAGNVLTSTEP
jgi:hypothetical protein